MNCGHWAGNLAPPHLSAHLCERKEDTLGRIQCSPMSKGFPANALQRGFSPWGYWGWMCTDQAPDRLSHGPELQLTGWLWETELPWKRQHTGPWSSLRTGRWDLSFLLCVVGRLQEQPCGKWFSELHRQKSLLSFPFSLFASHPPPPIPTPLPGIPGKAKQGWF